MVSSKRISEWLGKYFGIFLLCGFLLGMMLPGLDNIPAESLAYLMGLQIFFSSFKITRSDLQNLPVVRSLLFYLIRFICFPIVLYYCFIQISGVLAVSSCILALMPAGVSSPAFTAILSGNVALTLSIVTLTSLISPFIIPALVELCMSTTVEIDSLSLFCTLASIVFLPLILHFPFRRSQNITTWINDRSALIVLPLVLGTIIIALGRQRSFILQDTSIIPLYLFQALFIFSLFYLLGWKFNFSQVFRDRMSYILSSGINNVTLSIVVASIYFSSEIATWLVISNLAWVLVIIPLQIFITKKSTVITSRTESNVDI